MNPIKRFNLRKAKQAGCSRRLITLLNPMSPISEQYRTLRTNIQYSNIDKEIKILMLTSANPGEGKTLTASNLAIVFAQQGKRVLLIDADLRKPAVHYGFRLDNLIGLTTVITKHTEFLDSIQETDIENLSILPSGPAAPNPSELLSSKTMKIMLEEAKVLFDLVIIDTPPLLLVTDAQILANQCDGTILVINSGKTKVDEVRKAKELLMKVSGKIIGVVLNKKKQLKEELYYYRT